jgi:GNAT superfamily N-acetyltransferase
VLRDSGVGRSDRIYDLIIHENLRRKGYASRTLELVEDRAKVLGTKSVELHVFGTTTWHRHSTKSWATTKRVSSWPSLYTPSRPEDLVALGIE